jgi:aryl-alcohol dehydrogenase-like predicted oxidoreductase
MGEDPNQQGASRRWIIREVENSLRRLNTDWIDLYQVHRPPTDTDTEETLGALNDLVPDEIVPPGTTINPADNSYDNPALQPAARRR